MNRSMTVGQAACRLVCRYTQSRLVASCVCWIVPIVTCESGKRTSAVVPNRGDIYNTQGFRELMRFSIFHQKYYFQNVIKP